MSSYNSSFTYLGKNSKEDFGLIVSHFSDNADSGEVDTFLSTDAVYTDSYDGTRQNFYGAKYNSVATPQITLIKENGSDFGVDDNRQILKWLTGSRQSTWMDFYVWDESTPKYRMLGRVSNVSQYKMGARIVGLIVTFESVSPYAYSGLQSVSKTVAGSTTMTIHNDSDDVYSYVYMNVIYANGSGNSLTITNNTTGDVTSVTGLAYNETINISDNMMITSDKPAKTFGSSFNFVFPRLQAGDNTLKIDGAGYITFKYITPVKIGDMAIDINVIRDPICDDSGNIIIEKLPWNRISDKPNTLQGYGVSAEVNSRIDAAVQTFGGEVGEVKSALALAKIELGTIKHDLGNVYTKEEVDSRLEGLTFDDDGGVVVSAIPWINISGKPNTLAGYGLEDDVDYKVGQLEDKHDTAVKKINLDIYTANSRLDTVEENVEHMYTKTEIDEKLQNVQTSINKDALNAMLNEVFE